MRAETVAESAAALDDLMRALPAPRVCAEGFSTEVFIASLTPGRLDDSAAATIEVLAKKIEVGRRLRCCYSKDVSQPAGEAAVDPAFCAALAGAFVHFGALRRDWKWINTALKMDYGILQDPPFTLPPPLARILDAILEQDG
jgi:hypothetical protein